VPKYLNCLKQTAPRGHNLKLAQNQCFREFGIAPAIPQALAGAASFFSAMETGAFTGAEINQPSGAAFIELGESRNNSSPRMKVGKIPPEAFSRSFSASSASSRVVFERPFGQHTRTSRRTEWPLPSAAKTKAVNFGKQLVGEQNFVQCRFGTSRSNVFFPDPRVRGRCGEKKRHSSAGLHFSFQKVCSASRIRVMITTIPLETMVGRWFRYHYGPGNFGNAKNVIDGR